VSAGLQFVCEHTYCNIPKDLDLQNSLVMEYLHSAISHCHTQTTGRGGKECGMSMWLLCGSKIHGGSLVTVELYGKVMIC
jgi:hypothetical protein